MNRSLAAACLWVGCLSGPSVAGAQSVDRTTPTEPVLKRAPSVAEWSITYFRDGEKAEASLRGGTGSAPVAGNPTMPRSPVSVTISKNGDVYREVANFGGERSVEKWIVDGLQVYETAGTGKIARAILPGSQLADDYSDYRRSDFEELEWIDLESFHGLKDLGGRQVFEFRVDAKNRRLTPREVGLLVNPDESGTPSEILAEHAKHSSDLPPYIAYLDVRTQLPVYFDDGQSVRVYQFSEQPPRNLEIPPRFKSQLTTWQNELARRQPLPSP